MGPNSLPEPTPLKPAISLPAGLAARRHIFSVHVLIRLAHMEHSRRSKGWRTFWEHWWLPLGAVIAVLTMRGFEFFTRLSDGLRIWCYGIGLVVAAVGVS